DRALHGHLGREPGDHGVGVARLERLLHRVERRLDALLVGHPEQVDDQRADQGEQDEEAEQPARSGRHGGELLTSRIAARKTSWRRPLVATTPWFFPSLRPVVKSSGRPCTSVTRPPASSITSAPAAWSQMFSRYSSDDGSRR